MSDATPDPFQQMMAAGGLPETVDQMRTMLDGFAGMLNADPPEVGAFHERVLVREVGDTRVTANVAVPKGDGPHPVLVYLHGGGWVWGSPNSHHKLGLRFAEGGYLVFNVDYRLAPEHPFPAAFEDCVDAIRWAARVAPEYGGDPSRLAVGGDSAGGNLSSAAAIALANDPEAPKVSAALLIYGAFDFAKLGATATDGTPLDGPMAEAGKKMIDLMAGSYIGIDPPSSVLEDPRVSPMHAAEKLPPSHLVCGEADPLVAQARELADRLAASGVEHELVTLPAMPHGFVQMEMLPQARQSIDRMLAFLGRHLAG